MLRERKKEMSILAGMTWLEQCALLDLRVRNRSPLHLQFSRFQIGSSVLNPSLSHESRKEGEQSTWTFIISVGRGAVHLCAIEDSQQELVFVLPLWFLLSDTSNKAQQVLLSTRPSHQPTTCIVLFCSMSKCIFAKEWLSHPTSRDRRKCIIEFPTILWVSPLLSCHVMGPSNPFYWCKQHP